MDLATVLGEGLKKGKFWSDAWSLVEGCTPVSPGCANCWLAAMQNRNLPNLSAGLINPGSKHFNGLIKCHEERLEIPLRATKPRVFAIWSDLFHHDVPTDFLNRAFDVMNRARRHRFIIITKRPHRAADYLRSWPQWSPMPNVTILVTMEDQQRANERCPYALELVEMGWRAGALCEPLLGPIDMQLGLFAEPTGFRGTALKPLFWLITGGESGKNARPVHPHWVRSLRDQAQAAGVPFMFKQWGEWAPRSGAVTGGSTDFAELDPQCKRWPQVVRLGENGKDCRVVENGEGAGEEVFMQMVGKKLAGNVLDGATHLEVPAVGGWTEGSK